MIALNARFCRLVVMVGLLGMLVGLPTKALMAAEGARATVVWISIDGIRPDYVDRADTPTLDRLMAAGAHTRQLVPVFPSVTFASHISQATGVKVRDHGVPGNAFYDSDRQRVYRYPPFANLLRAEPIWFTATRQGVRTAVLDWPMAHWQENARMQTAHHKQRFDGRLSDRERLEELVETWRGDEHEQPLHLLMTWIGDPDRAGHRHGPDAPEVADAFAETDALLSWFVDAIEKQWQATANDGDALYLIISTDHGMSPVHTLVHPYRLVGISRDREDITVVTTGNVGHIHLDQLEDEGERRAIIAAALAAGDEHDFVRVWQRDDLPDRWQYNHPTRTGDVVMVLDTGYTFSVRPAEVTADVADFGGPLGMHGYDPGEDPNMLGYALFHRWPLPLGGHEIEQVHSLQLHPTVARLLGIEPAAGAGAEPIELALPGE
ncbi:alkaline phosphatase family protein [Phycisphaerales bacterium AB-hyl4]|uniref:Alkaline phosphatase family protein n=1 Tax=Natronomicrosphaera hydrolytica TaxID=3242702 RepID=A0ABV4U6B1_9BACT